MKDKKCHPSVIESNKTRKGKTYEEFYGLDRAQNEALKRKAGNRLRWEGVERKTFREHGSTFEYPAPGTICI